MSGPFVTTTDLLAIGLITQEQAQQLEEHSAKEWTQAWDDVDWWNALAEIVWNNRTWRQKFLKSGFWWQRSWIQENRGW